MKRKQQSLSKVISGVWIRRSEVRDLGVLLQRGAEPPFAVETDAFTYDNLDELVTAADPIHSIDLKTASPHVSVTIQAAWVHVFAWNDDLASTGKFHEAVSFVERHRIGVLRIHPWIWGGLSVFCSSVSHGVTSLSGTIFLAILSTLLLIPCLVGLLLFGGTRIRFRAEARGAVNWRGVSWDLTKLVVAALLGMGATIMVQSMRSSPTGNQASQATSPVVQQSPAAHDGGSAAP